MMLDIVSMSADLWGGEPVGMIRKADLLPRRPPLTGVHLAQVSRALKPCNTFFSFLITFIDRVLERRGPDGGAGTP